MPVLFLDFDGVLHPEFCHESRHFECVHHLASACGQRGDLDIVVSSTWRHTMGLSTLKARFPEALARRIIAVTPAYTALQDLPHKVMPFEREAECLGWMRVNRPGHATWIAVDDRPWLYRPFCSELFLVNGKTGLDAAAVTRLLERLERL
ncbi:HAD domain-containing protein [Curvibacter lanceolatus]|uniref:HAD domain-containing protein n=1 Tax=Curvibacter lanceolatus TaxID=86182 RepID=UPI0003680A56|nr:HAD domain-containing protein [Curvibacter lanceolatus]